MRRPGRQGPWKRPVFVTRCVRALQSAPDFQGHGRAAEGPGHIYPIIKRLSDGKGSEAAGYSLSGSADFASDVPSSSLGSAGFASEVSSSSLDPAAPGLVPRSSSSGS